MQLLKSWMDVDFLLQFFIISVFIQSREPHTKRRNIITPDWHSKLHSFWEDLRCKWICTHYGVFELQQNFKHFMPFPISPCTYMGTHVPFYVPTKPNNQFQIKTFDKPTGMWNIVQCIKCTFANLSNWQNILLAF